MKISTRSATFYVGSDIGSITRERRKDLFADIDAARRAIRAGGGDEAFAAHQKAVSAVQDYECEVGEISAELNHQARALREASKYLADSYLSERRDEKLLKGLPDSVAAAVRTLAGASALFVSAKHRAEVALSDASKTLAMAADDVIGSSRKAIALLPSLEAKASYLHVKHAEISEATKLLTEAYRADGLITQLREKTARLAEIRHIDRDADEADRLHLEILDLRSKAIETEAAHNDDWSHKLAAVELAYVKAATEFRQRSGRPARLIDVQKELEAA
jgi:hypothetical protein